MLHHPFEWINDFDNSRIEQYLRNFDFILCGHRHKAKAIETKGTKGSYVIIAAGASYDSRDYPNGYNFVHFDTESAHGRVYLRRWDGELGRWINGHF